MGARAVLLIVILALAACREGPPAAEARFQVDTLPSGLVQVTNDGVGLWTPETAWALEEDLRIGKLDEEGPEQFAQVGSILTDSEGRIYVLEAQTSEVRVFSADGEYSHTIGRQGEGPGEIGRSWGLNFSPEGQLWVWDVGNRRYSVFETDGDFVTSYRRPASGVLVPWNGGFVPPGHYVDWGLDRPSSGPNGVGPRSFLIPIRFTPPDAYDTLPPLLSVAEITPSGRRKSPYRGLMIALGEDGRLWFAHTDEYTVYERTLEGDTVRTFSIPSRPLAVSDHEIDSIRASYADNGFSFERERFETTKRLVTRLRTDNAGHLFVIPQEPGVPQGTTVDVFRDSGEYLGRIELPETIEITSPAPYFTADHMYAIVYDDFDVPYVVRWRIVKPSGPPLPTSVSVQPAR